jgi:hypothetical protein
MCGVNTMQLYCSAPHVLLWTSLFTIFFKFHYKLLLNKLKRVGWILCSHTIHPSYFTKDDTVHHLFLNKSFAINLRGKLVRWALCNHIIQPLIFYCGLYCSLFFKRFAINLRKTILNTVDFMIQVMSFF